MKLKDETSAFCLHLCLCQKVLQIPHPPAQWQCNHQPSQIVWRVVWFPPPKSSEKNRWKLRMKKKTSTFWVFQFKSTSSLSSASKRSTSFSKTGINLKPASKRAPSKAVNDLNIKKKTDFPRDKSSCSQMELSPGELNKDGIAWRETIETANKTNRNKTSNLSCSVRPQSPRSLWLQKDLLDMHALAIEKKIMRYQGAETETQDYQILPWSQQLQFLQCLYLKFRSFLWKIPLLE